MWDSVRCSPRHRSRTAADTRDVRRRGTRLPDWPLLGFILMIDAFTPDNGAMRGRAVTDFWRRVSPETCARLGATARHVLGVPSSSD
jgi:hypothetical protein